MKDCEPSRGYSQVPAFSAADRAMIDVLTTTRSGRLAVVELKADEDIHLPLQGLDYWARVEWHHARGEFQRFGYFEGRELSSEKPLLFLVAPALHVHPSTDMLAALSLARNRMGVCGDRRALARGSKSRVSQTTKKQDATKAV